MWFHATILREEVTESKIRRMITFQRVQKISKTVVFIYVVSRPNSVEAFAEDEQGRRICELDKPITRPNLYDFRHDLPSAMFQVDADALARLVKTKLGLIGWVT